MKRFGFAVLAFIFMFPCVLKNSASSLNENNGNDIDLKAFYSLESEKYEFPPMVELLDNEIDTYYEGLFNIELDKHLIYSSKTNEKITEIVLLKVKNAADLENVISMLYSRKDDIEAAWQNTKNSCDITLNDDYVFFIVSEHARNIADDFNAIFRNRS